MNDLYIMHYGVGHDKGGHSGRYPWGSGKNPKQDLGTFKKDIKSKYREAKKKTSKIMGKHPAWWRENYADVLHDARIYSVFGAVKTKNRDKIKSAVERKLKTDPKFKETVQQSKREWAKIGKEISDEGKSFVDYYKKNGTNSMYARQGKKLVDKYATYAKDLGNMSDAEFATYRLFDQQRTENKIRIAGSTVLLAYLTMKITNELNS